MNETLDKLLKKMDEQIELLEHLHEKIDDLQQKVEYIEISQIQEM